MLLVSRLSYVRRIEIATGTISQIQKATGPPTPIDLAWVVSQGESREHGGSRSLSTV